MPISPRPRVLGLAALAVTAMLGLAACAPGGTTTESVSAAAKFDPNKKVSIVFESYNLSSDKWKGPILDLVAQFEEKYPNVDVTTQASDSSAAGSSAASVQRQLLAGNPPDVAQLTFDALDYAASDLQAQPLDELFGQEAINEQFEGEYPTHPKVRDFGVVDGHTYGVPYVLSTPILYYNATALKDAGITDPDFSTWDSVAAIAEQLSAATGTPSFANSCLDPIGEWCYQSMIRSAGGRVLSEDGTTIMAGEREAVSPLVAMQKMYAEGLLQNAGFADQYEGFAAGTTLLHINSASLQGAFQAGAAAGGWELGAAPMPGTAGQTVVPTSSGSMLSIYTEDTTKQAAAWEFIKFMTSPAAYDVITPQIGYLPLRSTMAEEGGPLADWAASNGALLEPNIEQLDSIEPWVSYPGKNYVQISTIIMDAAQQVVFQGADPQQTMADAAQRAQALVE